MSKRWSIIILCSVMAWLCLLQPTTYASGDVTGSFTIVYAPGDPNGDGVIDASDITCVEYLVAADPNYTPNSGFDANQDGRINALDITKTELLTL